LESLPALVKRRLYPYVPGKISKPIKLDTGYLILKVVDRREAGFLPLEEAKDVIKRRLLAMRKEEVFRSWFKRILEHYGVEVFPQHL